MGYVEMTQDGKVKIIQYINTIILSVIGIFSIMLFATISEIKDNQAAMSIEIIKIKTVQDINTVNINTLDTRIEALEYYNLETLKTWIDNNYIRKPQK